MHNFKELKIWQKARILVKEIYLLTKKYPADERFGLTSQTRRAAVSIMLNIAEGSGRKTNADFSHFLDISVGSIREVQSAIIVAFDLEYIIENELNMFEYKCIELQKMIFKFQENLNLSTKPI
jgi:four helix bundle protein